MRVRSVAMAMIFVAGAAQGLIAGAARGQRFPQPVRVGDLAGRAVLEPVESQRVLGRVQGVVREAGGVSVVIELRRWFGWTTRLVAVPVGAVALVGDAVDLVGDTPAQVWERPVFDPAGATALAAEATIEVGLAKPSH